MLGMVTEAPDKAQSTSCLPNFNVNVISRTQTRTRRTIYGQKRRRTLTITGANQNKVLDVSFVHTIVDLENCVISLINLQKSHASIVQSTCANHLDVKSNSRR